MTVPPLLTLRGHHLLCSVLYSGSGYSPEFVENFDAVCRRISSGERVRLTWRPDTICQPMLGRADCHCHASRIKLRDLLGFVSASIATRKLLWPGRSVALTAQDVQRLRAAFRLGVIRSSCVGCEWFQHCTRTSRAGYPRSKLRPGSGEMT